MWGLSLAGVARAEDRPRLEYRVDESATDCPSEEEFRRAVVERLGYEPFVPESGRRLLVEVGAEDGELSATGALVEADGASTGVRRLTGRPGRLPRTRRGAWRSR